MPPRRSKRIKTSKALEPPPEPVKKKAPRGSKTSKKYNRAGGLKDMLEMPLDVIYEILMHCYPQDLLNLLRTSKSFRGFLMRRSSARIWKEALERIEGLPACPTGLIEPAWATLVFRPFCTVCGTGTATEVLWAFHMRLCKKCRPKTVMDEAEFQQQRLVDKLPEKLFFMGQSSRHDRFGRCWLRSDANLVWDAWLRRKLHQLDKAGWKSFVKQKAEEVKAVQAFQASCFTWVEAEEKERTRLRWIKEDEEERIREERYAFVVSKLTALDWGTELELMEKRYDDRLRCHKAVKVARPLTDRSWASIEDKLITFMEAIRDGRLRREDRERLDRRWHIFKKVGPQLRHAYLKAHPKLRMYGLNVPDLAHTPEIMEIISAPLSTTVDERSFAALQPRMETIVEGWRARFCEALRALVRGTKTEYPEGVEPLGLATTIFACGTCAQSYLFFQDVLTHPCQRPKYLPGEDPLRDSAKKPQTHRFGDDELGFPLALSLREYVRSEEAWFVVELCGKDPLRTTVGEMDMLGVRLVQGNAIMTWRAAIVEQTQFSHATSSWRVATLDEATEAMRAEKKLVQTAGKERRPMYANGLFKLKLPRYEPMRLSARSR